MFTFIKSVLHYDEHFPDGCPVNRHDRLFLKPQLLWPKWKDSSMILRWSSHRDTTTTNKEFLFTKTHINIIDYILHTYKKTLSRYCAFNVKHGIRSHGISCQGISWQREWVVLLLLRKFTNSFTIRVIRGFVPLDSVRS